ncbi:hypothetical protein ACI65C_013488 [Semiaphis heraclei]
MSSRALKMIRIAVKGGQVGAETAVSSEGQLATTSKQQHMELCEEPPIKEPETVVSSIDQQATTSKQQHMELCEEPPIKEPETVVSSIDQQATTSQQQQMQLCEEPPTKEPETVVISKDQQATTSQQQVKKVTHRKSVYLITRTSATKSIIKRQPILLRSSESSSDELSLGGSSDSYQPSSEDNDSSSSGTDTPSAGTDTPSAIRSADSCPTNKPKKRLRDVNNWGKVKAKRLKNSGQAYKSRTGKMVDARKMGPPCSDKCILSCTKNISEDYRSQLFSDYWAMGSFQRQRDYLNSCIETLIMKYRRIPNQIVNQAFFD